MDENERTIEQEEIDDFGLHEVDAVVRVDGHRIPASLPYGFDSWEEWWPPSQRPPWVDGRASIPSHRVDQLPDPKLTEWNVFVAGVLVVHDYDRHVAHDPLQVLPVVRQAVTVRQCEAPGCENVIHVLSTSEPTLRAWLSFPLLVAPQARYCRDPECMKRRTRERVAEHRRRRFDVTTLGSTGRGATSAAR